jgi:hypothetical protein
VFWRKFKSVVYQNYIHIYMYAYINIYVYNFHIVVYQQKLFVSILKFFALFFVSSAVIKIRYSLFMEETQEKESEMRTNILE